MPLNVLLAEDDDDLRTTLKSLLELAGHSVRAVADGRDLLDCIAAGRGKIDGEDADVVITDVRMPGLNGLSVVEGLRDSGWTRPVIVMTAFADDMMERRVGRLSKVGFLRKPFEPLDLERALQSVDGEG